ncbi:MAG TPA: hypothetical protein VGH19_24050 [Verrucomicrobiae bacterium]
MTVTLTSDQERFVQEQIRAGKYSSVEQMVAEGLRWVQSEEFIQQNIESLRQQVDIGIGQLERGESSPAADVFARLEKRVQKKA